MRQFTPHPDLVKAISSFGETPFRVTMLRDRYLELFSTNRTKNEVRRWAHSFMRTFVKHGLLIELNGTEYNVAHYMATEKLLGERGTEQSGSKDVSPLYNYASEIQKRLQARQKDILISLGATEELESLSAYTGANRTSIPALSGHPFRFNPDTDSGINQPVFV